MDLAIYDETILGVPKKHIMLVKQIIEYAGDYTLLAKNTEVSVTFVNNNRIQEINRIYRGIDQTTDVISFAINDLSENDDLPLIMNEKLLADITENLGDIFISVDKVSEQADFLEHSYERELGFLVVHGFLHLNGYDHMETDDEKVMFKIQKEILNSYGLTR